jgi:hypothetical protein
MPSKAGFDRVDWLAFGLTSFIAFAGYWFTLAPNVTLEFSGLMSTGAMYAGVPHVPGYPVWTLYSWCFTKLLPFSNIAWRVAVGSAVASAAACGLVAMMVSHYGRRILCNERLPRENLRSLAVICGTASGLTLAFSGAVWRKAVIVDIWALSLLLFTSAVFLLTRWLFAPDRRRWLYASFLLVGMALTNSQEMIASVPGLVCFVLLGHAALGRDIGFVVLPLALLATARNQFGFWLQVDLFHYFNLPLVLGFIAAGIAVAVVAVRLRRIGSEWPSAAVAGLCLLLGLAFYFYVPMAAMSNPPVNWGYARTLEGFAHVLARGQYERLQPTSDFGEFIQQLIMFVRVAGREFGWMGIVTALLPIPFLRGMDRVGRNWLLGLLAVFIAMGPLVLALMNPATDFENFRLIMTPYFSPAYAITALWSGIGLLFATNTVMRGRLRRF